jgi:hypothetical protein
MDDTIFDDEIIEAAVKLDEFLLELVEQGFGPNAINGIVLARLMILNRETDNESDFYSFLTTVQNDRNLTPKTLQ